MRKLSIPIGSFLIVLLALQSFAPMLEAQAGVPSQEELDQLLAPVALYPDSLLSQITTASTNPQEILDADNWLDQHPGLNGTALTDATEKQGFDPAFIALVNFPNVLATMAQNIDDYAAIGEAFMADQGAVSASIQRLRAQAYEAGTLRSNSQQEVQVQPAGGQTVYVIQPANPQIVYVPQYDPTVVYVGSAASPATMVTFGVGIGIGALMVTNQPWGWGGWGWNWGARRAYYNHAYWGGWGNPYRPPHPSYRRRPIVWSNRPGYRGNWRYRPRGYRPPYRSGPRPGRPGGPGTSPRPAPPNTRPKPGTHRPSRPGVPNPGGPAKPIPNPNPSKPGHGGNSAPKPGTPGRPTPAQPPNPGSGRPGRPAAPGRPSRTGQPPASGPGTPATPDQPKIQPVNPGTPDQPKKPSPRPAPKPRNPNTQPKPGGNQKPAPDDAPKPQH
jgi:hypothetical protein